MKANNIRWLYFRLRAMSAGEVLHRFWEQAKRSFDSRRTFHFNDSPIALPVIPGLRDRVRACSDTARRQFRAVANDVRDGRYHFLGRDWPNMGDLPDWHLDPVTGRRWPDRLFCHSVPFRHNRDYGDVKYVWELNRLQHLQFVAAAAACDDDPELAKLCISQICSWIDANPPFNGLNWSSGIELALRVVSFIVVFSLIPQSSVSPDDRRAVSASLRAHLYWLERYPSRYSSANNHLIAEAAGLFLMSLLLPELPRAENIQRYARNVLNTEALLQFHPDGVPAEQSPTYGAFSAEWILCANAVARAVGDRGLDTCALNRLSEFGGFLSWITDKSGNVPRIGDDDEGRVVFGGSSSNDYVASIKYAATCTTAGTLLAHDIFENLLNAMLDLPVVAIEAPTIDTEGVRTFTKGGYTAVRDVSGGKEHLLIFDHGPLGYLGIAAHGHADALAIWAHYDGRPVLIDAGTYLYHSGGKWREYFRGSNAHNTLVLGGMDQSLQAGDFNWSSKALTRLISCEHNSLQFCIEAEHDGYLKQFGTVHRRRIERKSHGRFVIEDTLISNCSMITARVEIGFVVCGDLNVWPTAAGWIVCDESEQLMTIDCPFACERTERRGAEEPNISGWMSVEFGSKQSAWRLAACPAPGTKSMVTTITFGDDFPIDRS